MIRIDLSRDEIGRKGGGPLDEIFARVKNMFPQAAGGGNKASGGGGRAGGGPTNSTLVVALGISAAAAILPSLFLSQYKQYVINSNQVQIKAIQESVVLLNADISKLTPYQKELESYEQQKRLVRERLDVIRQLLDQRGTPVNVLDAIGQNLPQRTFLQSIDLNTKGGIPLLNILGSSLSNEEISDFVDKLSESVYFNDVVLQEVGASRENNVDMKKFNLVAHPKARGLAGQTTVAAPVPVNAAAPNVDAPPTPETK